MYKPLCFENNSNIRRDPSYWVDTYRSKVSRDLDEADQDILVNLHYHGTKQRLILRRILRQYKPLCLLLEETMQWTKNLTQQLPEEEITVDIPLRRIEVMDKIDSYIESSEYAVIEEASPGYLNEREKEIWNEHDRLAKEWEGEDCVERPSMPGYRQRELELLMDDYKSNELLKTANKNVMWKKGGAGDQCFTEKEYAVTWRKEVDWNLEQTKRNPTVFREFPVPYSQKGPNSVPE